MGVKPAAEHDVHNIASTDTAAAAAAAAAAAPLAPERGISTMNETAIFLRRSLVVCASPATPLSDLYDCANLALELGKPTVARLMWEIAFVEAGFSPARRREQRSIAARTGLWGTTSQAEHDVAVRAGSPVDQAIAELKALGAFSRDAGAAELVAWAPTAAETIAPTIPAAAVAETISPVDISEVARLVQRLFKGLQEGVGETIENALADIDRLVVSRPPLVVSDYTADLEQLVGAVAATRLRALLVRHHDLYRAPFGSSALFAAAAVLSDGGLGPYFRNVGLLLRDIRDLFGILYLAHRNDGGPDDLARWLVILATHLDGHTRLRLANDAGDRGLMVVLRRLLASSLRMGERHVSLLLTIRDAALDNGDLALGAEAQEHIVRFASHSSTEWAVLGEVLATYGADEAADAAFTRGLLLSPADILIAERLAALRADRFKPFEVLHGFGSPPWRVALRGKNGVDPLNHRMAS